MTSPYWCPPSRLCLCSWIDYKIYIKCLECSDMGNKFPGHFVMVSLCQNILKWNTKPVITRLRSAIGNGGSETWWSIWKRWVCSMKVVTHHENGSLLWLIWTNNTKNPASRFQLNSACRQGHRLIEILQILHSRYLAGVASMIFQKVNTHLVHNQTLSDRFGTILSACVRTYQSRPKSLNASASVMHRTGWLSH